MGPDLARLGGKYPDSWHYHHMEAPKAMVPESNMPAYAFLSASLLDPAYTQRKMDTLGFPYAPADIQALQGKNEMDAMVAYLQKLGTDIGWRKAAAAAAAPAGELVNPFGPEPAVLAEGADLYAKNCAQCHGEKLEGNVGPELTGLEARDEAELFQDVYNGIPDGGMPSFSSLGAEKLWKIVTFMKNYKGGS
jgi:cytochrome c oxidase cbb3-type subunit 2